MFLTWQYSPIFFFFYKQTQSKVDIKRLKIVRVAFCQTALIWGFNIEVASHGGKVYVKMVTVLVFFSTYIYFKCVGKTSFGVKLVQNKLRTAQSSKYEFEQVISALRTIFYKNALQYPLHY